MMKFFLTFALVALSQFIFSQGSTYKAHRVKVNKDKVVTPRDFPPSYNANIIHLEAPSPNGDSYRSFLMRQKIKSREAFPIKKQKKNKSINAAQSPITGESFGLIRYSPNGTPSDIFGGIPNDNTMAISDSGLVLMGINSIVYAYDINTDTAIFPNQQIPLNVMAQGAWWDNFYDPKIIYDKEQDRFILVFLRNNDPASNVIIVCFSTTNDPNDSWNVYTLPGNPLNNNRWTDFPAISITETDLFITGNLIVPNVPWQVGFDGSVIWQVGKEKGYNGDSTLNTIRYDDIRYGGNFVRNLHPVQGSDGAVDELYLLSNRNFDLTNDSIFVLHVQGTSKDTATSLSVDVYKSNLNYGVPPNGRQQDTDTSDANNGLQTNDARVLGAIKIGDDVQFVGNTVNPSTGFSAIYHGTISSIADQPVITATIIGDSVRDYGYPNIAWTGNEECDIETIIAFNYTSFTDFPGMACVYYDNEGNYSEEVVIKEGDNYIDRLPGGYERWGDYFGLQRHYPSPGTTYAFGFFGLQNNVNTGWCSEVISPDSSRISLGVEKNKASALCEQEITIVVTGGTPPYSYLWSNESTNNTNTIAEVCTGDSMQVTVTDSRGCTATRQVYGESIPVSGENLIFPNPFTDRFVVQFNLDSDQEVTAKIYDLNGRVVSDLIRRNAKKGLNELVFSLTPLRVGEYILRIDGSGAEILKEKVVKR